MLDRRGKKMLIIERYKAGIPDRYFSHFDIDFGQTDLDENVCDCGECHCPQD